MSRCIACGKPLEQGTMKAIKFDGTEEDMCARCREAAFSEYSFLYDHDYELEEETRENKKGYFYDFFDNT